MVIDRVEVSFIMSRGTLLVVSPNRHRGDSKLHQNGVKVGDVLLHSQGKRLGR